MKLPTVVFFLLLGLSAPMVAAQADSAGTRRTQPASQRALAPGPEVILSLADFGAIPNGLDDAGPALQNALDALGEAGGGTLFVPAGRYAIITPVQKNFAGLATAISIVGVESLTVVPPLDSAGSVLTRGLDLVSEFAPQTGEAEAIRISGLTTLLIKDLGFIGTPGVATDAQVTLTLNDVRQATISHCEFYGLRSMSEGGAIVQNVRTGLHVAESVFLGCATDSGVYGSVIQNYEWKSISIAHTIFADYGSRPELFGKLDAAAPFSWVNIGNAALPESDSPAREVKITNVFFDEGALNGLASLPNRFQPASATLNLVYVSGVQMNVTNLGGSGFYLDSIDHLLIEDSHYGWSHNADNAVNLLGVNQAILDRLECLDSADRIRADSSTGNLTIIDSVYNSLDSLAQTTRVINTAAPDDDAVQYVRRQFTAVLGRDPDPAAHFYWSAAILACGDDSLCIGQKHAALNEFLTLQPQETFTVSGRVVDENGVGLSAVSVAVDGSLKVTTKTGADGQYKFSNLPTSGVYSVVPTLRHYTFVSASRVIVTPAADQTFNPTAVVDRYEITGRVADVAGNPRPNVTVTLSGSEDMVTTTGADGDFAFMNLAAGGNYTLTPELLSHTFSPASLSLTDLDSDQSRGFVSTLVTHTVAGILLGENNDPIAGATVTLSGSQQRTTTSDLTGRFSFAGVPEGSYTITPERIGNSFSPSSLTYGQLTANEFATYAASVAVCSLSGRVSEPGGQALSGATVSLSGEISATTTTDNNGDYIFSAVPRGGDYTLEVSKPNYGIETPIRAFNALMTNQTADFTATHLSYLISGHVSSGPESLDQVTVTLSGSQSGTATTDANGNYSFTVPAGGSYTITPAKKNYLFTPASVSWQNLSANHSDEFQGRLQSVLEFSAASYSVTEGTKTITVTVTRSGDVAGSSEVIYSASDGSADQRGDVIPVIGRLSFEPDETTKTFIIFITDDARHEVDETLNLALSDIAGGNYGNNRTAVLTIVDNDDNATAVNPIDDAQFFVRQQYRDFLNRPPDDEGLAFWSNQIASCGSDAACLADRRMNVSAAFFLSIEFQQTGFLVYRFYQAAFARAPRHLDQFLLDTRTIGAGVVVNAPEWEQLLAANTTEFSESFVARSEFSEAYPTSLTPAEFVDLLNAKAGNPLTASDITAASAEFAGAATSEALAARARVLRRVAENQVFSGRQLNTAFVLMQYFGYLQRNPYETPDANLDGYNFWLHKLDEFGGDFRRADMVKSFLVSGEYRGRFGTP